MDRYKVFDRALYAKQLGGNGIIVIADTIYLISGVFFGIMSFRGLLCYVLFINMFVTCVLYHNFIVSRGDMNFELNTQKIVYYPTTRLQFLLNKYIKTLLFLVIQLAITLACLGLGYVGKQTQDYGSKMIGSFLIVFIAILMTSGASIIVMHTMPLGIYLSMILYYPLTLLIGVLERRLAAGGASFGNVFCTILILISGTIFVWLIFLWLGKTIFERIN